MKLKPVIIIAAASAIIAGGATNVLAGGEKEDAIPLDKLPAAVHKALAAYAQDSEVTKADKGDEDGKKVFEFDIDQGGKKFELTLSKKGKFLGREEDIEPSAVPAAALAALKSQAGDATLSDFEKAEDKHHKISYEGTFEKGGQKTEVSVDETGKVIGTEDVTKDND